MDKVAQRDRSEAEEAKDILMLFGLTLADVEACSAPVELLCAWCEPELSNASHGCCKDHAELIRNSFL